MQLENALRFFSPKSLHINDSPSATASDSLTVTDVMASIGILQSQAELGLALILAKNEISCENRAIDLLAEYAEKKISKLITKSTERKKSECMKLLAKMAYRDYSKTAATTKECECCNGHGFLVGSDLVVKHKPYRSIDKINYLSAIEKENTQVLCKVCNGKGEIADRCRCNGTGTVLNREKTKEQNQPVYDECKRCSGRGFARMTSSTAFKVIKATLPDLNERT